MQRNIEIKARIDHPAQVLRRAASLSDTKPEALQQHDTFFRLRKARLKLRSFADGHAELIYYKRPDQLGPKMSAYTRIPLRGSTILRRALSYFLDYRGEVSKHRYVFHIGSARVHIDDVKSLGHFIEIEVVLRSSEREEHGVEMANELMEKLGIASDRLVSQSYIDLVNQHRDTVHFS